jgi:hypothetical protein
MPGDKYQNKEHPPPGGEDNGGWALAAGGIAVAVLGTGVLIGFFIFKALKGILRL